ncbi:hypothetical protein H9I48_00140 [Wolbachia pipientis]|uniref:hypothetical protein n=1 Tax=Wolbachia pipientis TaxID=955 RepID=UPI00165135C0|nr:hypothetical protein [Wolbachia pipientis]MBC6685684.1 hypothetical protein [Wolbachia pipientis]
MGNSTKELVDAFNLNNYGIDKVNTNFTVEGKKIVGLFASGTNTKEYLREIGEEIIKQHYGTKEVASRYYNLNCFPFVLGANPDKEDLGNGIVKVKLADSMDPAVIHNLEIHFANEFKSFVGVKVAARLQEEVKITKKEAYEWIRGTVQTGAIGSPYLYCIAFNNEYLEKRYFPRIFELFKSLYISEFNSRLENCGLKSSDFYDNKDGMLYIKNVSDKVIKSVTGYVKGRVALDFRTSGSVESKVENCKNVLSELILKATGKFVDGYDYDDFTDEKKIKNGHSFALIPFIEENGQLKSLSFNDAGKINRVFNKEIPNGFINSNFISDIKGKTANPQFANCKEPVYAFSNKGIAQLLPIIMRSPITYNEISGSFEFVVDLERHSLITEPDGSRTPPNQGDRDSGYDSNSPPKKDSGSSSGGPGPSTKISHSQVSLSRQVSMLPHNLGAAQNVQAETSASFQPIGFRSSQSTSSGFSDSLWTQSEPSSWKGADESMRTGKSTWYVSSSGIEDVNDVEPEKQQVSDGCSEAKPQESESPRKRRGDLLCKERWLRLTKFSPFKRHSAERDTMCSSKSDLVHHVTKKPPLSERSASERKAKSYPPSKETSPVTEACTKNKPEATELKDGGFSNKPKIRALTSVYSTDPDQREELLKKWEIKKSSVKAQLPGERSSQASADSGLGKSLERGQSPSLIEEFNDKSLINSRVDSPKIKKYWQEGKEVFV